MQANIEALAESKVGKKHGKRRDWLVALLFLLPSVILLGVFVFYPMARTLYLSTSLTNLAGIPIGSAGFNNYLNLFTSPKFYQSLGATAIFVVGLTVSTILIAFGLASLALKPIRSLNFVRTLYSSTMGVSASVGSILWLFWFSPTVGILNRLLTSIHLPGVNWLSSPTWAIVSIIIPSAWMSIGFAFLVILGALQTIPTELYQVADLEGAGRWMRLRKIVLPHIKPTLQFVLIVTLIDAFQTFGQVDMLTAGGPDGHTNFLVYAIYTDAFVTHNAGKASAEAIILTLIIMVVTFLQFSIGKDKK